MARRLASNFQDLFGGRSLHIIDHKRGKYPYEVKNDLGLYDEDGNLVLAVAGRNGHREFDPATGERVKGFKRGYETDLASIPTRLLKKLLEPMRRKPWDGIELAGRDWIVYVWVEDEDGTLVPDSWFEDPVGYAAVPHDKGYSTELVRKLIVDGWFLHILTVGNAKWRRTMYAAVVVGGWPSFPHPLDEVTDDRLLAVEAADRLERLGHTAMRFE